ncbi:MAG: YihA family ribosome biogenesis GTP-binding protein, partial [Alphaproteobacteria bacterium]|nr:YihA family ribosome biogenesis GTP-binding protein [Alphaproteobacteria bacterium]
MGDHAPSRKRGREIQLESGARQGRQGLSTTQADDAGRSEDAAAIEAGRLLFARPCRFVAGVADAESLPPLGPNEAAFAGRSNVGKSSLVNALTDQKALARASHTPGRTRQLNFFDLDGRLALVDLPGYGHAAASKSAIKQWTGLVIDYLKGRANLRRVLLLIDGRHGIKPIDQSIMTLMDEAAVSYQIVLTKIDEVKA